MLDPHSLNFQSSVRFSDARIVFVTQLVLLWLQRPGAELEYTSLCRGNGNGVRARYTQ